MEAIQLQKVSVTHGDNGVQTKSPVAANSGKAGMDSKPVNFGSADEKGRTAPTAKDVEGASKFKNAPGHKTQDLSSAPKPVTKDGSAYDKSPVAK
jgi:inosine-uridine nucleoside N-ribohydrolase